MQEKADLRMKAKTVLRSHQPMVRYQRRGGDSVKAQYSGKSGRSLGEISKMQKYCTDKDYIQSPSNPQGKRME